MFHLKQKKKGLSHKDNPFQRKNYFYLIIVTSPLSVCLLSLPHTSCSNSM